MKFTAPVKTNHVDGWVIQKSPQIETAFNALIEKAKKKCNGTAYLNFDVDLPHKPRTTGPRGQSNHFHGHCQSIAHDTGEELGRVKLEVKRRAMKRGYPAMIDEKGNIVISKFDKEVLPQSEADADIEQESMLIEETHQVAAEMNIKLIEYDEEGRIVYR